MDGDRDVPASLARVVAAFAGRGELLELERLGSGHIHETFVARVADASQPDGEWRLVLQSLNRHVFRDPEALARNAQRIADHLRAVYQRAGATDIERRVLTPVAATDGRTLVRETAGAEEARVWRATRFIAGTRSVDVPESADQAREVARAFGEFIRLMSDLPGAPLEETIPHFHDLPRRVRALAEAERRDGHGRAERTGDLRRRAHELAAEVLDALRASGVDALPPRIVHNDCKINNLLLDADTGAGVCVIDLDTVMNGSVLCDFGQLVRTAVCPAAEDERDLSLVALDRQLFAAVAAGFLDGTRTLLEEDEVAALPLAGAWIALEDGVRFLTDHLDGDVYYRIHRPDHNLDRARAQLHLARGIFDARRELAAIVARSRR